MSDPILDDQIAYYRARASEYDEWFYRLGRYDHGQEGNQLWFHEAAIVTGVLHSQSGFGHVLELACGTGIWTQELIKIAKHVTALDASEEMMALNRAKLQSDQVTYQEADLFKWLPATEYDMVFFGFWLSHVPPESLEKFLNKVNAALKPGGRLFFVDSRRTSLSTARDHHLPEEGTTLTRKLNDGREFTIVKVFYEPQTLTAQLSAAGLAMTVHETPNFFLYADGSRKV